MPQLLAGPIFALLASNSVTFALAGSAAVINTLSYAAVAGIGLLTQRAFREDAPKPEDVQGNYRQATPTRTALYGQGKLGGPYLFRETSGGSLRQVIALSSRQLDSIQEYWIDDNVATRDVDGVVTSDPYGGEVKIQSRLGLAVETAYQDLIDEFPGKWTTAHRGDGIATIYTRMFSPDPGDVQEIFPNGANTLFRVVARGCRVYDPREGTQSPDDPATWTWSDNLALVALDYMRHRDGMRIPDSILLSAQAVAGWIEAANDCDDLIPLKAGGTEPRYRCWGTYNYSERPADVLRRIMLAGNARLKPTPDGGLHLEVGKWRAPTLAIDETMVTGFQGLGRGKSIMETANVITAQYTSPPHDYQATDADPWIEAADVSERGEISASVDLICSPSHAQTRRLMKIEVHRANPAWVGTLSCNLKALPAFGERFVHVELPSFGIDADFEVMDFQFVFGEHSTLVGVTLALQSISADAYAWDAATEEGTAPAIDQTTDESETPLVTGLAAVVKRKQASGSLVPYAELTWNAKPRSGLTTELQGKRVADAAWQAIAVSQEETTADSFTLNDGDEYEFQARYVGGAWSASVEVVAVADPTPPDILTDVAAGGGSGQVVLAWTSPNSPNFFAVNIRRNTVNNETGAALVHTEYGPASNSDGWTDTGLAAGTYYYFLRARNGSGVENATPQTTGPVAVT